MAHELPDPEAIQEEPLRPLLALVAFAAHALQIALDAEYPEPLPELPDGATRDPAQWTAEALAGHLESLRSALDLHRLALDHRNARSGTPASHEDF